MARIVALIPDLLFGSRVQAMLGGDHDVALVAQASAVAELLDGEQLDGAAALVVDLTDDRLQAAELVESLSKQGALEGIVVLGFYAHVDAHVRQRAEAAGFDLVVPRSRMAREGDQLVARLIDGTPS